MKDFEEGIKKEVAEVKFLIHDLRVENFINDIIHFHVTLNTDLEIFDIEQVAQIHSEDLFELKKKAQDLRKAYQTYSNTVKSFSPSQTILISGNNYIETIQDICELIINPLWGRFDKVSSFLPGDCRSVQAAQHYKNDLRWICGVYYRIEHFLDERSGGSPYEEFDLGTDVEDFTRNVIKGYVTEKSSSRVDITFDKIETIVVGGNQHRLRRMLFNLVMNAVDAMSDQQVGVLRISITCDGDRVQLTVKDNGSGMPEGKKQKLLSDKDTLDGELHSLGFVFVRQTVREFHGELLIDSVLGKGTTITVSLPYLKGKKLPKRPHSKCEKYKVFFGDEPSSPSRKTNSGTEFPLQHIESKEDGFDKDAYGKIVLNDFEISQARSRGCIFAISAQETGNVDFFTHRPYEEQWDISHEDLSPMFYEATVRGRIEENEYKEPELILKAPQTVREYFEFKNLDEREFSAEKFNSMVRDEYIRIARKLIETGLPGEMTIHVTGLRKFFPDYEECFKTEPFPLDVLARQKLSTMP